MFGLAFLLALGIYLLVSYLVVRWAIRHARKNGKSAKLWGFGAGFVMYNLVFWDWIPTVAVHQYYCAKESGFWVYKTLDQWKAENPGVMEELDNKLEIKLYDPKTKNRFWTTQRFYTDIGRTSVFHAIGRTEEVFVDAISHKPIARSVNFFRGQSGNVFAMGGSLDDFRQALIFGLGNRECGNPSLTEQLRLFRYEFQKMGEKK